MAELPDEISLVNAVGGGDLRVEVDLERIVNDLHIHLASYEPDRYPAAYMQFERDCPKVSLFRTGSYHIAGAKSIEELWETRTDFLNTIENLGVPFCRPDDEFAVRNLICVSNIESDINLNNLAIKLGLEQVEYEPEQFPGLVYRSPEIVPILLVFASGKIVITGSGKFEHVRAAQDHIKELIIKE